MPDKKFRSFYNLENQKLNTWADHLGCEFKHHDALEDAIVTYEVFKHQREVEADNGSGFSCM